MSHEMRSIGVIGGGTAGYLTALAIKSWRPETRVTLIESSRIPIIGVGEATTPPLVPFLHNFLGLDVHQFMRDVKPTWKLGIRFEWGRLSFNYPFMPGLVGDAYVHDGDIDHASLGSVLMNADRMPFRKQPGGVLSMLPKLWFAYHLDNEPFVHHLRGRARRAGVVHRDATVARVEVGESPDLEPVVTRLVTETGQEMTFDLYIDCTGFRSLLLGEALKSPFEDFSSSLFCDRAVVANVPHGGKILPYTTAETMDHGWCWNIPQVGENHRGYVFASSFASDQQAADEMRERNPGMSEPHIIPFSSGRRRDFWRGNVIAVGNSYGFVEPLESTALHMILIHITRIINLLDENRAGTEDHDRDTLNRRVGAHWDYLRWFLAIHYKFNQRKNTPFWRACRADVDISGLQDVVDEYRADGPLSARDVPGHPDGIFGPGGIDVLLLGQQVRTATCQTRLSADAWTERCAKLEAFAADALDQSAALELMAARPELLDELVNSPESWCREMAGTLPRPAV